MNNKYLKRSALISLILCLIALASLSTATYAWFTAANREVTTSRVTARTGSSQLKLLISTAPDFSDAASESAIAQVNSADAMELMPVSTDDLLNFVYCPMTSDSMADTFRHVENEEYYYHGRIYLMASASQLPEETAVQLYIDGVSPEGNPLAANTDGSILNAARLGLHFSGDDLERTVILSLSGSSNAQGSGMNTSIDGQLLAPGTVLHSSGTNDVTPAEDPADPYGLYTVKDSALPAQSLCTLKLNTAYTVDVYYYLEGCDPDCTDTISADASDLRLWFYGMLA